MVFTEDTVYFLSSKKKIEFLKQVESQRDKEDGPSVKLLIRDKVRWRELSVVFVSFFSLCDVLLNANVTSEFGY